MTWLANDNENDKIIDPRKYNEGDEGVKKSKNLKPLIYYNIGIIL